MSNRFAVFGEEVSDNFFLPPSSAASRPKKSSKKPKQTSTAAAGEFLSNITPVYMDENAYEPAIPAVKRKVEDFPALALSARTIASKAKPSSFAHAITASTAIHQGAVGLIVSTAAPVPKALTRTMSAGASMAAAVPLPFGSPRRASAASSEPAKAASVSMYKSMATTPGRKTPKKAGSVAASAPDAFVSLSIGRCAASINTPGRAPTPSRARTPCRSLLTPCRATTPCGTPGGVQDETKPKRVGGGFVSPSLTSPPHEVYASKVAQERVNKRASISRKSLSIAAVTSLDEEVEEYVPCSEQLPTIMGSPSFCFEGSEADAEEVAEVAPAVTAELTLAVDSTVALQTAVAEAEPSDSVVEIPLLVASGAPEEAAPPSCVHMAAVETGVEVVVEVPVAGVATVVATEAVPVPVAATDVSIVSCGSSPCHAGAAAISPVGDSTFYSACFETSPLNHAALARIMSEPETCALSPTEELTISNSVTAPFRTFHQLEETSAETAGAATYEAVASTVPVMTLPFSPETAVNRILDVDPIFASPVPHREMEATETVTTSMDDTMLSAAVIDTALDGTMRPQSSSPLPLPAYALHAQVVSSQNFGSVFNSYTVYNLHLSVRCGEEVDGRVVSRRYSDFLKLRDMLMSGEGSSLVCPTGALCHQRIANALHRMEFPEKVAFAPWRESVIQGRKTSFDAFLQTLCCCVSGTTDLQTVPRALRSFLGL